MKTSRDLYGRVVFEPFGSVSDLDAAHLLIDGDVEHVVAEPQARTDGRANREWTPDQEDAFLSTVTEWAEKVARGLERRPETLHLVIDPGADEVQTIDLLERLPYLGWSISTGFLSGDLFTESSDYRGTYDVQESAREYARQCREALEREFPGADVSVPWQHGFGATPLPLQTFVVDPEGRDATPGDYGEIGRVADRVERICGEVWESWEWVVYEEDTR